MRRRTILSGLVLVVGAALALGAAACGEIGRAHV